MKRQIKLLIEEKPKKYYTCVRPHKMIFFEVWYGMVSYFNKTELTQYVRIMGRILK